ncbi:ABC transporter substrate-binding protein [Ottowia thiooxydans]|uniref:ABC transporter substrate-binding protein n=1 Tax=Ottowia thiooxydans TaxID=219182 RepID=UPI0003FE16A2|nr:ABC transporter substrate-binding protein [Ottowia thiooxydans]
MQSSQVSKHTSITRRGLLRNTAALAVTGSVPALVRAQPAPIKIGMSAVTTGRFAYAGLGQVVATRLLFDQVNGAGGIEGRKLELVVRDSRNLPEEAVKNVRSLINAEGCTLIMSAESSSAAAAINEGLRDTKAACFQLNSEASSLTADPKKFNPLVFRVARQGIHDAIAGGAIVSRMAKERGITRWATCAPDYAFGRETTQQFIDYYRHFGGKMDVAVQAWPKFGAPDFTDVVTRLLSSNPQAIYSLCFGGDLISLVEQGNLYGLFKDKLTVLPLYSDYGVIDTVKQAPPNVIVQNRYNRSYPDTPANRKWYDDYVKLSNGAKPHNWSWQTGAAAQFIVDGLRATKGDPDPVKVAAAIRGSTAQVPFGVDGKVTLRASDNTLINYPMAYGTAISTEPFVKDWVAAAWNVILEEEANWKKKQGYV